MPTTAEQLYREALSLPLEARADLIERLVARRFRARLRVRNSTRCTGGLLKSSQERWRLSQATRHWRESAHFWLSTGLQLSSG